MIRLDAVATWHMRGSGIDPQDWLARLRRHDTGHLDDGRAWTSWRQLPDAPPGGQWFERLELIMLEGGDGHLRFDPVQVGEARYMQESGDGKGPKDGAVMLSGNLPETLLAALPGRPLGALVDFTPLRDTPITEAHNITIATLMFTVIAVKPVRQDVATPLHLTR